MAIEPPPPDPDRERLEALIAFSRKRMERTEQRMKEALEAHRLADAQLGADIAALEQWLEEHPPAQPDLF